MERHGQLNTIDSIDKVLRVFIYAGIAVLAAIQIVLWVADEADAQVMTEQEFVRSVAPDPGAISPAPVVCDLHTPYMKCGYQLWRQRIVYNALAAVGNVLTGTVAESYLPDDTATRIQLAKGATQIIINCVPDVANAYTDACYRSLYQEAVEEQKLETRSALMLCARNGLKCKARK